MRYLMTAMLLIAASLFVTGCSNLETEHPSANEGSLQDSVILTAPAAPMKERQFLYGIDIDIPIPTKGIDFEDLLWLYPPGSYRISTSGTPENITNIEFYVSESGNYPMKAVVDKFIPDAFATTGFMSYYHIIDDKILITFIDSNENPNLSEVVAQLIYDLPTNHLLNGVEIEIKISGPEFPTPTRPAMHIAPYKVVGYHLKGMEIFRCISANKPLKANLQVVVTDEVGTLHDNNVLRWRVIGNMVIFRVFHNNDVNFALQKVYILPEYDRNLGIDIGVDVSWEYNDD